MEGCHGVRRGWCLHRVVELRGIKKDKVKGEPVNSVCLHTHCMC